MVSPNGIPITEGRGIGSWSGMSPDRQSDGGIEILCAFDERFVPHAATMLCSLLENNRVFRVHIFHGASIGYESERFDSSHGETEVFNSEISMRNGVLRDEARGFPGPKGR